jgi:hypothetical protein
LSFSVPAACANRLKKVPDSNDNFAITRSPQQEELKILMPVLNKANVNISIKQAAVWIISDDADYNDLGVFTNGYSRAIGPYEAARAAKTCFEAEIDIRRKRIWNDRKSIAEKLPDGPLKNWLNGE